MSGSFFRTRTARLGRIAMGERLGGFVYGTIVVLTVIVAGAIAYPDAAGHIAAIAVITTLVLWLAHVYAHALAHSVGHNRHLSLAELQYIARRESSIVEAGIPPLAALLLGVIGAVSTRVAVWMALGIGLAVLAALGLAFARVERLSWPWTLLVVTANLGLGLLLIGLKLVLTH